MSVTISLPVTFESESARSSTILARIVTGFQLESTEEIREAGRIDWLNISLGLKLLSSVSILIFDEFISGNEERSFEAFSGVSDVYDTLQRLTSTFDCVTNSVVFVGANKFDFSWNTCFYLFIDNLSNFLEFIGLINLLASVFEGVDGFELFSTFQYLGAGRLNYSEMSIKFFASTILYLLMCLLRFFSISLRDLQVIKL